MTASTESGALQAFSLALAQQLSVTVGGDNEMVGDNNAVSGGVLLGCLIRRNDGQVFFEPSSEVSSHAYKRAAEEDAAGWVTEAESDEDMGEGEGEPVGGVDDVGPDAVDVGNEPVGSVADGPVELEVERTGGEPSGAEGDGPGVVDLEVNEPVAPETPQRFSMRVSIPCCFPGPY